MPRNEFKVPCSKRAYCSWSRCGSSRSMSGRTRLMRRDVDVVEQPPPAQGAYRKCEIKDEQRKQQEQRVRLPHAIEDRPDVDLDAREQKCQDCEPQAERQQRPQVEEPAPERRRGSRLEIVDRDGLAARFGVFN